MNSSCRLFFLFFIFLGTASIASGQPTLPEVGAISKDGINILSWLNPYTSGVKSITIQRSADSTYNYSTIGFIKNTTTDAQTFVDAHPLLGTNWYRVVVLFNSETDWKSNLVKLVVDSASIAQRKPLPPNDSIQAIVSKMDKAGVNAETVNNLNTVSYQKSKYIFTNPFTGNVNIELQDALTSTYAVQFYDQNGKVVLEIPRVNDTVVILDKRNFQSSGLFKFKLYKDKQEFDTGYITIY